MNMLANIKEYMIVHNSLVSPRPLIISKHRHAYASSFAEI